MHNKSSISHESIYESEVPVAKCHLRKLLKKRVISLILLEITEYHLSTLETFSILFRTTSGKKPYNFQYYTIIIMLNIKWPVTTYNNKKKIVVNLKKLIWPKNKKIKPYLTRLPSKKKKNEAHNFFVCEVFFSTLLRVELYVLIKFQQHGVCTDDE